MLQALRPSSSASAGQVRGRLRSSLAGLRGDSLARNSLYIMATTACTALLGYIYWIAAARLYPAGQVGLAAAIISAMTLTSSLTNLGLAQTLIQVLPGQSDRRAWSLTLNAALLVGALAGVLGAALVVLLLPLFSSQLAAVREPAYAAGLLIGVPIWTAGILLDAVYTAGRAAGNMLARNVVFAVLKIPLLGLPLALHRQGWLGRADGAGILASWTAAGVVAVCLGLPLVRRVRPDYGSVWRGMVGRIRLLLSLLAGHHFINLGGSAPMYLLPTMVAARLSTVETAYFYTTWMVGSLFFMVSPAVASALFAEGSASVSADIWPQVRRSLLLICSLLLPMMAVFLVAGHAILSVFGPAYAQHGFLLLALLIFSAVPDAFTNVCVSVLRVQRRLRHAGALNLGMAAITLILAWVLLPTHGIASAGWAWLIAQLAGSVALLVPLARERRYQAEAVAAGS